MISIRIMTYNVTNCSGSSGRSQPEAIAKVIGDSAPDIVALQQIDIQSGDLDFLAKKLRMHPYGTSEPSANALLSYYPIKAVRSHDLGHGGRCLRSDLDFNGQRLHLFNVRLTSDPLKRRDQVSKLCGPDLLGSHTISCPVLLIGDFADYWWGAENLSLTLGLQRVRRPVFRGTYPAKLPLFSRDRAYIDQALTVLDARVAHSFAARDAAGHLPLILTLKVKDTRLYLRNENKTRVPANMEIVHG
jgi:endonuclease/exonuclease/phosphatase family metal-dependent hydrolase